MELGRKFTVCVVTVMAVLGCVLCDGESMYYPALAMHCGKATQHRDIVTGNWISGDVDCIKDKNAMLRYCKQVYPTLQITDVLEDSETAHISGWCHVGSKPPCKGHSRSIKPVKCIIGDYQPKALDVKEGCTFEHKIDYDVCHSPQYWEDTAGRYCHTKTKTLSDPQMLKPCTDVDQWKGVQFLCCDAPDVPKPKANKGKKAESIVLQPASIETIDKQPDVVNSICLQPKKIGFCRAVLPAWHFNADNQECEFFHYGGCGGNDNKFDSRVECERVCEPGKVVKPAELDNSLCGLPSEAGMCLAYFEHYYYDANAGVCKMFVYGGCGGNANNFMMKKDCEAKCKGFKNSGVDVIDIDRPVTVPMNFGLGPVMLDENMKPEKAEETTTLKDVTATTVPFYTDETTIDNEHDVFADKLEEIKAEHQAKVNKILEKWDEDNTQLSTESKENLNRLEEELQQTITALEDEYDGKMSELNKFHLDRMDQMIAKTRSQTLQRFLEKLKSDKPKLRHILTSLEQYIAVERQDKTHVMQHYYMAVNDDFEADSIPDLKNQLNDIDTRVNKTRMVLSSYPDLLSRMLDEVEEILATMPESPDFEVDDGDDGDLTEEEYYDDDVGITREAMVSAKIEQPIEIDDGGIPDPDICRELPVPGPCRASLPSFYYDLAEKRCKTFYYGGCGGNENRFMSIEECQAACPGEKNLFDYADTNGVLSSEDILPEEDPFNVPDEPVYDLDDNSIKSTMDAEDELEDETILDEDVDKKFDYYGDPKNEFDVILNDPQSLKVKSGSVNESWIVWVGIGSAVLLMVIVVVVILSKRRSANRPPMSISVDKPQEDKEMTPEEKQLLALQQNGYENPTYKFFEKQQIA